MFKFPLLSGWRWLPLWFALLPGSAAFGLPQINEFMAANDSVLADEDGEFPDWIEIYNPDPQPVSLQGYHLTDDRTRLTRWTFPAVTLNAGAYLVVFASGKDRTNPAARLHTDFQLSADGGYLALVAPDGQTVVSSFNRYPPMLENESFGLGQPGTTGTINLTPAWNQPGNYANVFINAAQTASETAGTDNLDLAVTGPNTQAYMWFDFASRLGQIAPGSTINSATLSWRGAVQSTFGGAPTVDSMLGIYPVPDARHGIDSVATTFTGREIVNYYAANAPVAEFNAVRGQTPTVTWDVAPLVRQWVANPGMPQRGQIMILNASEPMVMDWNADAGQRPLMTLNVSITTDPNAPPAWSFFSVPTPGAANGGGLRAGPIFGESTKNPPQPVTGPLTVTAAVDRILDPVASVKLYYRRMFGTETMVPMADDGTGGDTTAADGIWTAAIPAAAFVPGEMTRWRFVATDTAGGETSEPPFREPLDSHQYFGTVAHDPALRTRLPVLHWFTTNVGGAGTTAGSRGSVYYDGEFYDNVLFNLHGQSTAGFPKKSYNIDFNRTQRFRWSSNAPRVADIDLLTNWADKSKVRHVLAYEVMREAGVPAHFAHTVRVEVNGDFFSTADFVEDADNIYLERAGLNPNGALYKMYNFTMFPGQSVQSPNVEKKNGHPTDRTDLTALVTGLNLTGTALTNYLYDNIDIPKCVTMLAANSVIRNIDMHSKNWYMYRDTGQSNEWAILPWDLDLSHGRVWNTTNTYFDNALYTDGFVVSGTSIRLVSHLFNNPQTRAMIMRRVRTLTDRYLQPPPAPGTPENTLYYERRLNEQSALIDSPEIVPSDARRDFEKWGSWLQRGQTVPYTNPDPAVETMARAIQRFKTEYLPARRNFIYNTQVVGRGGEIPLPQNLNPTYNYTPLVVAGGPARVIVPTSGAFGLNWIGIPANEPFDASAWIAGTTGVGYERATGYQSLIGTDVNAQMQSNNSVYIRIEFDLPNPVPTFDRLELRMKYDDGFLVFLNGSVAGSRNAPASPQWNSNATAPHEANPSAYEIFDLTPRRSDLRPGRNILAIQGFNVNTADDDMIIVPELYGGVLQPAIEREPTINFGAIEFSPASRNQDQEYVELLNPNTIAVDISDWRITGAIQHQFPGGTVLPANGALYLCPNAAAFRARTVSPKGGEGRFIQGGYSGHLSSLGETLTLLDASGAVNNTITYAGAPSDTQRYLVVSEVMYNPGGNGMAEYIELLNISDSITLNLTGVRLTRGVDFDFTGSAITSLAPGARVLIVRDLAAFTATYGPGLPVAGVFLNTSNLRDTGEGIKVEDPENDTVREFDYDDLPPWPVGTNGSGYSLVLIAPQTNPDHALPTNWRASGRPGGNPGGSDTVAYPSDPLADANGNGLIDLIDYALGTGLGSGPIRPAFTVQPNPGGGSPTLLISYPLSVGAERAAVKVFLSTDLTNWQDGTPHLEPVSTQHLGDGRTLVTWRVKPPLADEPKLFMRLNVTGQ